MATEELTSRKIDSRLNLSKIVLVKNNNDEFLVPASNKADTRSMERPSVKEGDDKKEIGRLLKKIKNDYGKDVYKICENLDKMRDMPDYRFKEILQNMDVLLKNAKETGTDYCVITNIAYQNSQPNLEFFYDTCAYLIDRTGSENSLEFAKAANAVGAGAGEEFLRGMKNATYDEQIDIGKLVQCAKSLQKKEIGAAAAALFEKYGDNVAESFFNVLMRTSEKQALKTADLLMGNGTGIKFNADEAKEIISPLLQAIELDMGGNGTGVFGKCLDAFCALENSAQVARLALSFELVHERTARTGKNPGNEDPKESLKSISELVLNFAKNKRQGEVADAMGIFEALGRISQTMNAECVVTAAKLSFDPDAVISFVARITQFDDYEEFAACVKNMGSDKIIEFLKKNDGKSADLVQYLTGMGADNAKLDAFISTAADNPEIISNPYLYSVLSSDAKNAAADFNKLVGAFDGNRSLKRRSAYHLAIVAEHGENALRECCKAAMSHKDDLSLCLEIVMEFERWLETRKPEKLSPLEIGKISIGTVSEVMRERGNGEQKTGDERNVALENSGKTKNYGYESAVEHVKKIWQEEGKNIGNLEFSDYFALEGNQDIRTKVLGLLTKELLGNAVYEALQDKPPILLEATLLDEKDKTTARMGGEQFAETNIITLAQFKYADKDTKIEVIMHEILHYCTLEIGNSAKPDGKNYEKIAGVLNEGLGEYFAQQACRSNGITSVFTAYQDDIEMIFLLKQIVGESALRKAYFSGDFGSIEEKFDAILGKNSFEGLFARSPDGTRICNHIKNMAESAGINLRKFNLEEFWR